MEYDYEIDAYSGAVVKYERDNADTTGSNTSYIDSSAAKSAALSHAGLTAAQVTELTAELDKGDGVYDVEFKYNSVEYDYEIDAYTGAVVKYEMDD